MLIPARSQLICINVTPHKYLMNTFTVYGLVRVIFFFKMHYQHLNFLIVYGQWLLQIRKKYCLR